MSHTLLAERSGVVDGHNLLRSVGDSYLPPRLQNYSEVFRWMALCSPSADAP